MMMMMTAVSVGGRWEGGATALLGVCACMHLLLVRGRQIEVMDARCTTVLLIYLVALIPDAR